MSRPMTADEKVAAYRREGLTVKEVTVNGKSWRSNNRNFKHGNAQTMNGQIAHHTGPWSTVEGMVRLLFDGRGDLPGPLCDDGIDPTGVVWMVGNGWCNHAGAGDPGVFNDVVADRPAGSPHVDVVDGNAHFHGDEVMNHGDGKHPYPNAQVTALVKVHAARARHYTWKQYSSILHDTWTRRKIDIYGKTESGEQITVAFLQREVARALSLAPGEYSYPAKVEPPVPPKPPTPKKDWFDMATEAQLRQIVRDEIVRYHKLPVGAHGPGGGEPLNSEELLQSGSLAEIELWQQLLPLVPALKSFLESQMTPPQPVQQ